MVFNSKDMNINVELITSKGGVGEKGSSNSALIDVFFCMCYRFRVLPPTTYAFYFLVCFFCILYFSIFNENEWKCNILRFYGFHLLGIDIEEIFDDVGHRTWVIVLVGFY